MSVTNRAVQLSLFIDYLTDLFGLDRPCLAARVARLRVFLIDSSFGFREQLLIPFSQLSGVYCCDVILGCVSFKCQHLLKPTNCVRARVTNIVFIVVK